MAVEIKGTYSLKGERERVLALLMDPAALQACLPGCDRMQPVGEGTYEATMKVGVAAVVGTYSGKVQLQDLHLPEHYTMFVEGGGPPGIVRGRGVLRLTEQDDATLVSVDGDAEVSGLIASVGQRLLVGVAKLLMGMFFKSVARRLASEAVAGTPATGDAAIPVTPGAQPPQRSGT